MFRHLGNVILCTSIAFLLVHVDVSSTISNEATKTSYVKKIYNVTKIFHVTNKSGATKNSGVTEASDVMKSSHVTKSSDVTKISNVTKVSGPTKNSHAKDTPDELKNSDLTKTAGVTKVFVLTEDSDVIKISNITEGSGVLKDFSISYDICSSPIKSKSNGKECKKTMPSQCSCKRFKNTMLVDCSHGQIDEPPHGIPHNTAVLLLDHNEIKVLRKMVFINNTKLIYLDLSSNKISIIRNDTFKGLDNLETLLLQNNSFSYTEGSLLSSSFQHLDKLKCLHIEQRTKVQPHNDYPMNELQTLKNLHTLFMNGLPNSNFTEHFSKLTSLRSLVLSGLKGYRGSCSFGPVLKGIFVNLKQITHLSILDCELDFVENGSFAELIYLMSLNLSYNTALTFERQILSNISYGLVNLSNFHTLNLTKVHETFGKCTYLDVHMIEPLNQTTVKEVILDSNRLSSLSSESIYFLPSNITYFSIKNNKLDIGRYLIDLVCNFNNLFSKLETLVIANQNHRKHIIELLTLLKEDVWTEEDNYIFTPPKPNQRKSGFQTEKQRTRISILKCFQIIKHNCPRCWNRREHHSWPMSGKNSLFSHFTLPLPATLQTVDFSGSLYQLSLHDICICSPNNLKKVKLNKNLVYSFGGPFYGMESVEYLDLAENYCQNITDLSFANMPNLRKLNLSSNFLGTSINKANVSPFSNLTKLTHLDLSNNKIRVMPDQLFGNLQNLQYLSLSENRLTRMNANISKLINLTVLDLSCNLLEIIGRETRAAIDAASRRHEISINLFRNKFICSCKYENYIKWIIQNKKKFVQFESYYCYFDSGSQMFLNDQMLLDTLRKQCTNYTVMILATSFGLGLILICIVSAVLYRYRWHLRYLYYSAKFRYNGYTRVDADDHFQFDVFVSYADTDRSFVLDNMIPELEEKRGLRLLVHERDFPFGTMVTENIHRAISSSRRTMLVISQGFLRSKWCKYEMNIAKLEAVNRDRDVLCVIMREPMRNSELPLELMDIITKNTYLTVPSESELFSRFWDSIETSIK